MHLSALGITNIIQNLHCMFQHSCNSWAIINWSIMCDCILDKSREIWREHAYRMWLKLKLNCLSHVLATPWNHIQWAIRTLSERLVNITLATWLANWPHLHMICMTVCTVCTVYIKVTNKDNELYIGYSSSSLLWIYPSTERHPSRHGHSVLPSESLAYLAIEAEQTIDTNRLKLLGIMAPSFVIVLLFLTLRGE